MTTELIALEFLCFWFNLGPFHCRLTWLPQGDELAHMKEFGEYMTQCGWMQE